MDGLAGTSDIEALMGRILQGDCLELMPKIPDHSIDMILCDPPYGITARNRWDEIIPIDKMWTEYKRILKPNGVAVLTSWGLFTAQLKLGATVRYQYSMVWCKPNITNQLNAKIQPLRKHEDIIVFYDEQPTYNPQGLRVKDSVTKQGKTSTLNYGAQNRDQYVQDWEGYPTTIIRTKGKTTGRHPTEKPVDLFAYLVKTYTNPGDIVLDNAAGSFTTMEACENNGRRWICMDKEDQWIKVGQERLAEIKERQKSLDQREGTIFSAEQERKAMWEEHEKELEEKKKPLNKQIDSLWNIEF